MTVVKTECKCGTVIYIFHKGRDILCRNCGRYFTLIRSNKKRRKERV